MEKIITIGNKDYKMKSSAWTAFSYKNETKRDFLNDIKIVAEKFDGIDTKDLDSKAGISLLSEIGDMIEIIEYLAYVMTKEADNSQATDFESFLKGIDNLFGESNWIIEVVNLALSTF